MPEIFDQQYIGGSWCRASGTQFIDVQDPNTGLVSAKVLPGTEEDVGLALSAAQNALTSWSATSVSDKCAILNRLKDQLTARP
jgi:acyl-CoA reductase-like NAD-dependent aldehyde dehydrogenase